MQVIYSIKRTLILAAKDVDIHDIVSKILELLHEPVEKVFTSIDNIDKSDEINEKLEEAVLSEFLNNSERKCLPHELKLRKNSVFIFLRNINCKNGLSNGAKLRVLGFNKHILKSQILNADKSNNIAFIN